MTDIAPSRPPLHLYLLVGFSIGALAVTIEQPSTLGAVVGGIVGALIGLAAWCSPS